MFRKVRFGNEEWILVPDPDGGGGALTTLDAYSAGSCSYAHVFADGRIMRFGAQVGTREDLTDLGEIEEPDATAVGLFNMLTNADGSWSRPGEDT